MAIPKTREQFKDYCLRKLGHPVIQINIDDDQIEDRIDEALSYYADYHFDGSEKVYLKHQITEEDKQRGYIETPEDFIGIHNIFAIGASLSSVGMFDIRYQFVLNELTNVSQYSMTEYFMTMQHISFMQEILVGQQPIRYNRHMNKLHIDVNWDRIGTGQYIIIEGYQSVNPEQYPDVWKDRWLQNYATAKIKYQWGQHLSKFDNVQILGGITYSGRALMDDAFNEITKLEEEMINSYSLPVADMIG